MIRRKASAERLLLSAEAAKLQETLCGMPNLKLAHVYSRCSTSPVCKRGCILGEGGGDLNLAFVIPVQRLNYLQCASNLPDNISQKVREQGPPALSSGL
jgi:hypothetical protein